MRKQVLTLIVGLLLASSAVWAAGIVHRGVEYFDNLVLTAPLTLENSETINTTTDATFDFTRNDAGTVTLTCSDNDATCAITVQSGGNAAALFDAGNVAATVSVGSTAGTAAICNTAGCDTVNIGTNADADTINIGDSTDTVVIATALTLQNSESVNTGADATFDFTRNTAGTVILTASDDDAVAALTVQSGGAAALGLDAGGAAAVNIGTANATSVSICNSAACDTITIGSNADADTITIGDATDTAVSITDDSWSIGTDGIAKFAHLRTANNATLTAADVNLSKAQIQAAGFFPVDTTTNAVDVDFGDDAALDAVDIGAVKTFVVIVGHATQALTVTAGATGVTTITTHNATVGTTAEDVGDMIQCTVYATTKAACAVYAAD